MHRRKMNLLVCVKEVSLCIREGASLLGKTSSRKRASDNLRLYDSEEIDSMCWLGWGPISWAHHLHLHWAQLVQGSNLFKVIKVPKGWNRQHHLNIIWGCLSVPSSGADQLGGEPLMQVRWTRDRLRHCSLLFQQRAASETVGGWIDRECSASFPFLDNHNNYVSGGWIPWVQPLYPLYACPTLSSWPLPWCLILHILGFSSSLRSP